MLHSILSCLFSSSCSRNWHDAGIEWCRKHKCLCKAHKCTLTGEMKENIDPTPGSVAWYPVVLPVKTLCSPLTLKQNAGRVFAEYWGNCSWGGPIKSVSNECLCVNRTGCSRGNNHIWVWPPGFWIHTWMFLPCSMFLDGMPGLTNMQSVSRLVQAAAQISLSVPLDRIKLWSLHNQMLTIKRCLFLTRASQALLCCPTVDQKLYKVNTDNYYHMTRFLWSVSSFVSVKSYTVSKVHFSETNIHPFKCCHFF